MDDNNIQQYSNEFIDSIVRQARADLIKDADVLREQLRECKAANTNANLAIADIANECAGYVKELAELRRFKAAALTLTTEQSILYVMEKTRLPK